VGTVSMETEALRQLKFHGTDLSIQNGLLDCLHYGVTMGDSVACKRPPANYKLLCHIPVRPNSAKLSLSRGDHYRLYR
ncbi:hypothetical protein BgiBS90_002349, partial [Biomphalaria glabrata]